MFACLSIIKLSTSLSSRHASIDPATRAARGLPEDLIRLCVGIEDADDLLEDLERALLEAGAITLVRTADGEEVFARVGHVPGGPLGQALDKLTDGLTALGLKGQQLGTPTPSEQEYLVSAPGKVILFGEHAVVHGVVSLMVSSTDIEK